MRKVAIALIGMAFLLQGRAQDPVWNEKIQQLASVSPPAMEYPLGEGDLVEISVLGVETLSQKVRIPAGGSIHFPYLGEIQVVGLSASQLARDLEGRLVQAGLLRRPQVSVFILEYRSSPVTVLGAVQKPGQYQLTQRATLVDVLAMAGGLDLREVGDQALVQRSSGEILAVDLKDLLEGNDLSLNIPLQGGDVVQVQERIVDYFYVIGEVGRAGAFELPADQEILLSQALAWAGGPLKTAKMGKGVLIRYDEQQGRQEIALDLNKVLKGKQPDFPIRPDDVLFVPGSNFKTIAYGLLGVIPNTVSRAVIWGPVRGNGR